MAYAEVGRCLELSAQKIAVKKQKAEAKLAAREKQD